MFWTITGISVVTTGTYLAADHWLDKNDKEHLKPTLRWTMLATTIGYVIYELWDRLGRIVLMTVG